MLRPSSSSSSRRMRLKSKSSRTTSMRGVVLSTLAVILVLLLGLVILGPPNKDKPAHHRNTLHPPPPPPPRLSKFRGVGLRSKQQPPQQEKHRIAIMIPFVGDGIESVPPYFDLFCTAARGSASLVDFLILHNGALAHLQNATPSNVILINLGSTEHVAKSLLRVMEEDRQVSPELRASLVTALATQLERYPYVLVEYKPALGYVFQQYLTQYTHWGYSDLDIMFGDLPKWITQEELQNYDVVTYGYGDQDRVYLRGQFTFHKNTPNVNQIWRDCEYLSKVDERFTKLLSGGKDSHFTLESAEGCYSAAILKRRDLRVKYAVKAFTDVRNQDTADTHGVYLGFGDDEEEGGQTSVVYKHGHAQDTGVLPTRWYEEEDYVNSKLQWEVGQPELVDTSSGSIADKKKKCMYWAQEKYQGDICVPGLQSTETIYWLNGKLYKQRYEMASVRRGKLQTAPFFHFQEWKRYYRTAQLSPCQHRQGTCVLTKEGAMPLWNGASSPPRPESPLGVLRKRWKGDDRSRLPSRAYCLQSSPRTFPPVPPTSKCDWVAYWQDRDLIQLLSSAPAWKHVNGQHDVTLALTLQLSDLESANPKALKETIDIVLASIQNWQNQPCVLVVHVAGATDEAVATVRERFEALRTKGLLDACLVAAILETESDFVSRKALLNMARDVAPTRWTLSGMEVERGLILSKEAALFAQRSAQVYSESSSGTVLFVPQFSVSVDDDEGGMTAKDVKTLSVSSLFQADSLDGVTVAGPDAMDCGFCEDEKDGSDEIFQGPYKVWRELTQRQVTGEFLGQNSLADVALDLEHFQQALMVLLTNPELEELCAINTSPILLVDNVGPVKDTRTVELAREVEEFGGMQCYNGLWLAQLATLGYEVNVLPGAFAASTASTRRTACRRLSENGTSGTSRCDGCFLFDEEHQNILDAIAEDERVRPAKTALLWQAATE